MFPKPSIVSQLLPQLDTWWGLLVTSPWFIAALLIFVVLSAKRHGELAYGSTRSSLVGWLLMTLYFAAHLLLPTAQVSLGLLGLVLIIMLSDGIVSSLRHSRSPFFVHNLGVLLGCLLIIHPASILLYPFILAKLRGIKSLSGRHITALLIGTISILLLALMLFAPRSWEGVASFLQAGIAPITQIQLAPLSEWTLILLDLLYLLLITIACFQSLRTSVVRVRLALNFHLQLAWILMLLHLLYGAQSGEPQLFILGAIFVSGIMSVHFATERDSRWIVLPLTLFTLALWAFKVWGWLH